MQHIIQPTKGNTMKQQLKTINHAFNALPQIFHGFETVSDKLFRMNADAERQHRRGRPAPLNGFGIKAAARLFTIRHLAEALEKPNRYQVDDILYIRTECLHAQAYANQHRAEILEAWDKAGVKIDDVLAVDYAELMAE
jgi:hypothetical protein